MHVFPAICIEVRVRALTGLPRPARLRDIVCSEGSPITNINCCGNIYTNSCSDGCGRIDRGRFVPLTDICTNR